MDDYIILPTDENMKKLADEYSKIKAKTFSDGVPVKTLAETPRRAPCNYLMLTVISAVILRSINSK